MRTTVYATMMAVCVCAASVAGAGCGVARDDETVGMVTDELARSPASDRATIALPVRSEDLVDVAAMQATLNAACPAPTTCTGFDSCASWSTTTSCGTRVCGDECFRCNVKTEVCISGIQRSTFTTRFRVCFNAQQQSCTEFQVFTSTTCQTSTTGDCCLQSPGTCGLDS